MNTRKAIESVLVYGMLLSSLSNQEPTLYHSASKDWQFYSLPDDSKNNRRNWMPYLIAYALFIDLLHEKTIFANDKSRKHTESEENTASPRLSPPTYEPPTVIETEPDFLYDNGDLHRSMDQYQTQEQHRNNLSDDTLTEKVILYSFQVHLIAIRYKIAKKHLKRCRQKCHRLKSDGDVSVCYWYLGKLALKMHFYSRATCFFQKGINKYGPAHILKQYQPTLSALHVHHSYAFIGAEKYQRAFKSCICGIETANTKIDLASAHLCYGDICRAIKYYKSALLQNRYAIKHARNDINCVSLLYRAHRNAGELCLHFSFQEIAVFYFQTAFLYLEFATVKERFQLIAQLVRMLPISQIIQPPSSCSLVMVDLCGLTSAHSARIEPTLRRLLFHVEIVHHPHKCTEDPDLNSSPQQHNESTIIVVEFEEAEEEQGDAHELLCLSLKFNGEASPNLFDCPIMKCFNESMSFEQHHLADDNAMQEPAWRPNFVVSHNDIMPGAIKPFMELCDDFRGVNMYAKGSTFNLVIHCMHLQPRFCQNSSEILQYLHLKASQFSSRMQNHPPMSTIYVACVGDTICVLFLPRSLKDCQLCLKGCTFNRLLDHLQRGVSLRPHIQEMFPQAIVPKPVLSLPYVHVRASLPLTVTLSNDSVMCIVGNSVPSQVRVGEEDPLYLCALPSTKTEAQGVAYILRTKPLLDKQATKSTVLCLMENSIVIHLAAHGMIHKGCFALILDPGQISCDSVLTSHDIRKLNLSAALVVLSCCDSGHGTISSDGIQGMARAFLQAGAQSVLTTQSKVPDKSASVFMQCFHWYLSHGVPSFDALGRAKHSMRLIREYSEDIHWNLYELHGREVIMQSPTQLVFQFGCRSAFPCLDIMYKLEKAFLDQPALPTAVQILYASVPEADTRQVAIDFAYTYHHHFNGGVHWISHGQTDIQGMPSQTALVISDGVYEGTGFVSLLGNANVHILLLLPSSTLLEEAKQLIKCIRNVHVHTVKPLSYMQAKQQQTVERLLSKM